jgi:hypothetical protein
LILLVLGIARDSETFCNRIRMQDLPTW